METASIKIPMDLTHLLKVRKRDLAKVVREYVAVEMYREGTISLGKAAEIAGISRWEMLEILAVKKVPLQYYPEDLEDDVKQLKKILE
jgi:predicted HTH domain antitoxin